MFQLDLEAGNSDRDGSQFDPIWQSRSYCQLGYSDCLLGVHGSCRIGENEIAIGFEEIEDIGEGVVGGIKVRPFEGHGNSPDPEARNASFIDSLLNFPSQRGGASRILDLRSLASGKSWMSFNFSDYLKTVYR